MLRSGKHLLAHAALATCLLASLLPGRATEYSCASLSGPTMGGKTVWFGPLASGFLAFPGFADRGYSKLTLNAGGTYTLVATNAAFTRSGTFTATNGLNVPTAWVEVWLTDFPEPGDASKLGLFDYCIFELERFTPTFTNIYEGTYRVTDGEAPTPRPPSDVAIFGGGTWETGTTVTLLAQASGDTPFTYTWANAGGPIAGSTSASLILSNVQVASSGSYTVTVANAHGNATASTALTITPGTAPTIVTQPQSRTNNPGSSFSLTVVAGGSLPRFYQWRKDGVPLPGATHSFLAFTSFAATNVGGYDVVVTNSFGATNSEVALLSLYAGPVITSQPANVEVTNTEPFALLVGVSGDGPFTYQWYRNGTVLTGATQSSYATNGTLNTYGEYFVRLQNPAGAATSAVASVIVAQAAPAYAVIYNHAWYTNGNTIFWASQTFTQGQTMVLRGQASGYPPIQFTWLRNTNPIAGYVGLPAAETNYAPLGNSATRISYYAVPAVQPADAGAYTLATTNPFGVVTSSVVNVTIISTNLQLLTQPTNFTAWLPSRVFVTLPLSFSSGVPATVRWYSNSTLIATLPNVSGSGAQSYYLATPGAASFFATVSNQFAFVTTSNAVVTLKYGDGRSEGFATTANFNAPLALVQPLPDSSVLVGGSFTQFGTTNVSGLAIVRTNGALDPWRAATNSTLALNPVRAVHRYADGRLLVAGGFFRVGTIPGRQFTGLVRLQADGTVDTSFAAGWDSTFGLMDGTARALAVGPDGTIALGGTFTTVSNVPVAGLALFDANGFLKTTLPKFTANTEVNALRFQPDGRLLVGGNFTAVDGVPYTRLARLNADGTVDATFQGGTNIFNAAVHALGLDGGSNIYVGGAFTTTGHRALARLLPNGGLDTNFTYTFPSSSYVSNLLVQADNKVIVGGSFTTGGGLSRRKNLQRLDAAGGLDLEFPTGGITPEGGGVSSVAFDPEGRLWVGGAFTSLYDQATSVSVATVRYLARLRFFDDVPPTPTLGVPFLSGGNLSFTVPTVVGFTYRVEYLESLGGTNWLTQQSWPGTGGTETINLPTIGAQRFYRVVVSEP